MLIIRREKGEWVTVKHSATGDTFSFRLVDVRVKPRPGVYRPSVEMVFNDPGRLFEFDRVEGKGATVGDDRPPPLGG